MADNNSRGTALIFALSAAVIVLALTGAALSFARSALVSSSHAIAAGQARMLALGAWEASINGLEKKGKEFRGFGPEKLGAGEIAVAIEEIPGADFVEIKCTGKVLWRTGSAFSTVSGKIRLLAAGVNDTAGIEILSMKID